MGTSASPTAASSPPSVWPCAGGSGASIWWCGSLQTGAISAGVANLACLLFLYLWLIQVVFQAHQVIIAATILSLVAFLFAITNGCLISGAVNRSRSFVLPWLCLYLLAILSLVVACAIYFKSMGMMKPLAIAVIFLLTYFYAVVAAFFHELVFEERDERQKGKTVDTKDAGGKDACLIALDDVGNTAGGAGDASILTNGGLMLRNDGNDTFTDLASRPKLLDTNPFKEDVDCRQDSSDDERTVDDSRAPFLPRPDEVIQVDPVPFTDKKPDNVIVAVDEADFTSSFGTPAKTKSEVPNQQQRWFDSPFRPGVSMSKSSDHLTPAPKTQALNAIDETRPATVEEVDVSTNAASYTLAISSSRPRASRSHSHSGLLGDIDVSFTPFKSGTKRILDGEEVVQTPPKMKVFLPKSPEDEDDESSEESLSGDEAAKPLDVAALSAT